MKEGWNVVKLGDVCEASNGLWKGKKPPYKKIAVIRNTNFSKDCKLKLDNVEYIDVEERQYISRKLEYGDIILEKSGGSDKQPVGRPVLFNVIEGDFSYSNFTSRLRINDLGSVDSHYLHKVLYHLYLEGAKFNLQSNTTGIHNLDLKGYLELEIPLPPLPEQHRIVKKLDAAFEKIDALKAKAEKNIENAKALFQQTLTEELEPKEGWVEKKFGEVCRYYKEQGKYVDMKYIGMEHIESCTGRLLGSMDSNAVLSSSFKFNKGHVLYGRLRPYLKKVYVAEFDGCCSTEIFPIYSDMVYTGFIKYWLLTDWITNLINQTSAGCRMPRGNMEQVKTFLFSFPQDKEIQQQIVTKLDNLSAKCKKLEEAERKTIAECDALKQAILRQAFNGEL